MSWLFKFAFYIALVIDGIAILLALYFIIEDATRFAGYPKNGGTGLIIGTTILCGWVAGSYYLYSQEHRLLASILAWIPAFPVLLYGLFILMFLILKPDMK